MLATYTDAGVSGRASATDQCELTHLYLALASRLERIVGQDVPAPDVVEDACQFAWSQLVSRLDRVRHEKALAWLTTTAVREAFRQIRRAGRELSLEAVLEASGDAALAPPPLSLDEVLEARDRLRSVGSLSVRQQRLLWLHAIGLSYAEMAVHEGCSRRTVERQLLRAKGSVRLTAAG